MSEELLQAHLVARRALWNAVFPPIPEPEGRQWDIPTGGVDFRTDRQFEVPYGGIDGVGTPLP